MVKYIVTQRRSELINIIRKSFDNARLHSKGMALRVLGRLSAAEILGERWFSLPYSTAYGGFPDVAYLGFAIGANRSGQLPQDLVDDFVTGLERLRSLGDTRLRDFVSDDVAVLGVADGLSALSEREDVPISSSRKWLLNILDIQPPATSWTCRMRALAGDLLDDRGRLRTRLSNDTEDALALEICLRECWPSAFREIAYLDRGTRVRLLSGLLAKPAPQVGDLEQAVVWLRGLDLLIREAAQEIVPSISGVVRVLRNTQHSFKRWVWEEKARRKGSDAARWLIDREEHVQAFLWSVLYPIYGDDLVDEEYLPGHGQVQPRFDLGIKSLRLIIEVKVIRGQNDFAKVEKEIAEDLGLYFEKPSQFERMVVYVYDDSDAHHPERYSALENALKQRERIEEVIIVRRPGMIPPRRSRKSSKQRATEE